MAEFWSDQGRFFEGVGPYIASGCMVFAFGAATVVLLMNQRGRASIRDGY